VLMGLVSIRENVWRSVQWDSFRWIKYVFNANRDVSRALPLHVCCVRKDFI
jgi:hypothetical protein